MGLGCFSNRTRHGLFQVSSHLSFISSLRFVYVKMAILYTKPLLRIRQKTAKVINILRQINYAVSATRPKKGRPCS